jgi:hypothetical protein
MILTFFLLAATLICGVVSYFLTQKGMEGPWSKFGPAQVLKRVRVRNRTVAAVALCVVAVLALIEAFVVEVHDMVLDMQYAIGDMFNSSPALYTTTTYGGLSWGLYLGIVIGMSLGMILGSYICLRRYSIMGQVRVFHLI